MFKGKGFRFLRLAMAAIIVFSLVAPVSTVVNAAETVLADGTYTIDVLVQDEAGAEHAQRKDDFDSVTLDVASGAITANITVTSSARSFTFKGLTDVNTSATNADGTKTYAVPIAGISERLEAQFPGGGNTISIYVAFQENTLKSAEPLSLENDGWYKIQTRSLGLTSVAENVYTDTGIEYLNTKHESEVVLEVVSGAVYAYVEQNFHASAMTFDNEYEDISADDHYKYKVAIGDIEDLVVVHYSSRYAYGFYFLEDTLASYDPDAVVEEEPEYVINATHTIQVTSESTNVNIVGDAQLEVDGDSITAYITVSGRPLVTSEYVKTTEEGIVYRIPLASYNDRVEVQFAAGGAATGGVAAYIQFDASTLKLADGLYSVQTRSVGVTYDEETETYTDTETEFLNAQHETEVILEIVGGAITAYVDATDHNWPMTFDNEYEDITESENGLYKYKLAINDLEELVIVHYRDGRYTYGFYFDQSTIASYDPDAVPEEGEEEQDYTTDVTHTITATFENSAVTGLAIVGDAQLVIDGDSITAYVTVEGRALVDSEVVKTNEDDTKVYKFTLNSSYDKVEVHFAAGGSATGWATNYILFDASTLTAIADTDTINPTHTITATFENSAVTGLAIVGDAQLVIDGDSITAYVTVEGRALVDSEVVKTNEDGTKVYKFVLDSNYTKVEVQFAAGGSPTGAVTNYIVFDTSTLKSVSTGTDDTDTETPGTETNPGTGTNPGSGNTVSPSGTSFDVYVSMENEDGSAGSISGTEITSARVVVAKKSLVAYVTATGRELKFPNNSGSVVSNDGGIRTYKLYLSSMDQKVYTTFVISGDNPNYGSGHTPVVYLVFSADQDTLNQIQAIYDGTTVTDSTTTTDDSTTATTDDSTASTTDSSENAGTNTGNTGSTVVTFTDTEGHWAASSIQRAASLGFINGFEDGTFRPNANVTRGEFAVILQRALGLEGSSGNTFTDGEQIPQWASAAIDAVAAKGYITGYQDGTFRSSGQLSRAELAVIIARVLNVSSDAETSFTDADAIPAWAQKQVAAIAELGIVTGRTDGSFDPQATTTRAEALVIILRMIDYME